MNQVLIQKSLPDELRRIAKIMVAAEIRQFSSRDCLLVCKAAAELERPQDETPNTKGGAS